MFNEIRLGAPILSDTFIRWIIRYAWIECPITTPSSSQKVSIIESGKQHCQHQNRTVGHWQSRRIRSIKSLTAQQFIPEKSEFKQMKLGFRYDILSIVPRTLSESYRACKLLMRKHVKSDSLSKSDSYVISYRTKDHELWLTGKSPTTKVLLVSTDWWNRQAMTLGQLCYQNWKHIQYWPPIGTNVLMVPREETKSDIDCETIHDG